MLDREEMVEFFRKNIRLDIHCHPVTDFDLSDPRIEVKLLIRVAENEWEEISRSETIIDLSGKD